MTVEQLIRRASDDIAFGLVELAKAQAHPASEPQLREARYEQAAGMLRNGIEEVLQLLTRGSE